MTAKPQTELEQAVGYRFQEPALLTEALCHSSYANETRGALRCNERLEFLGDSVLSIVVSNHLFRNTHLPEGELTKIRASLVCEKSLFEWAKRISLGDYLLLGHGEEQSGGRERPSILADAFEAVIGAVFICRGYEAARELFLSQFQAKMDNLTPEDYEDKKSLLQELVQARVPHGVSYRLLGSSGPDHAPTFESAVYCGKLLLGQGKGRSKKESEVAAAAAALQTKESWLKEIK